MSKILAIDLGTTYFKFAIFDRNGRLCDTCRIAPPIVTSEAGRMEVSAEVFANTIAQGITQLRNRDDKELTDVEAVTFATQTNSFLLLDADDRPLTPIILWPDDRARELDAEVCKRCGIPGFYAATGVPRLDYQFMAAKLLWLQHQFPETWKKANRLCLISDYLTLLLAGQHITEAGVAGLTGLLDIHRCRWWPEMLTRFDIDECKLPKVTRAGTDLGPIHPQAARRFGLPRSCRFVVGCLDQYAGAIGAGNVQPGVISETTGTVLATVQCADQFVTQLTPSVFQGPAFRDGLYWQMVFSDISANYLQWYRGQLPDCPSLDQLTYLAKEIEPGAAGIRLKTDVGLTSPENVFEGLMPQHTRGHAVRSIMEAVAFALGDQITVLSNGSYPQELRCAGGAARSELWLQIKADVLGVATVATQFAEPTSLGAAVLAEASLEGVDVRQIVQQWVSLKSPHRPDPQRHQQYLALRS